MMLPQPHPHLSRYSALILLIYSIMIACSDASDERQTSKVRTSIDSGVESEGAGESQINSKVTLNSGLASESGRITIAEISRSNKSEELFQIQDTEDDIGFSEPVMVTGAQLVTSVNEKCEPLSYSNITPKVSDLPVQSGDYVFCVRTESAGSYTYSFTPTITVYEATGQHSELAAKSCLDILNRNQGVNSGIYWLSQNGSVESSYKVYCDMETDGGGWTLVTAQFEEDQLTDWNEGIQNDYDPELTSSRSFALSDTQLPPHTRTSFGKGNDPLFITSVEFQYQTGDIPLTEVTGADDKLYQIHRNKDHYYHWHNPEEPLKQNAPWHNALTLDLKDGRHYTWSFSPMVGDQKGRGLGMNGNQRYLDDLYAWTVWVR